MSEPYILEEKQVKEKARVWWPNDYRLISIKPENTIPYWWGCDVFIWHIPLLKLLLLLALIGWFI